MKHLIIKIKKYNDIYCNNIGIENEGFKRLFFSFIFIPYTVLGIFGVPSLIFWIILIRIERPHDWYIRSEVGLYFLIGYFLFPWILSKVLNVVVIIFVWMKNLYKWIKEGFGEN